MPQTSIAAAPEAYLEGAIADAGFGHNVTGVIEDAAGIAPGLFVVLGSTEEGVKLPTVAADITSGKLRGALVRSQAREPGVYAQYEAASVRRRGTIAVPTETAVAVGDVPFIRYDGTGTVGAIRNDAGTTAGPVDHAVQPSNGAVRVIKGTSGAGIAVVEINLP